MNIIFFHANGIIPTFGGISRITNTLASLFVYKGNKVWYIGIQNKHKEQIYSEMQSFLPSTDIFSEENVTYVVDFVKKNKVDIVINQNALDPKSAQLLSLCKKHVNFFLVSCFHNSILTPVYNVAYQKEYLYKKKGLGWLFQLMRMKIVSSFITTIYIHKYRKGYLSTLKNSDSVSVLCDGQVTELCRMCGIKSSPKIYVIPNCINTCVEQCIRKDKLVLWVGTFDFTVKRPDNMLRIWKQIESMYPDWQLKMLGDGPSWKEMQLYAVKLGLKRVSFEGRVIPDEYYKSGSILCVTSVHEAFSLVVLEAQRMGCVPVLNNSFTSASLLVQDGQNGYLVPAFNNEAFIKTLSTLMGDEDKRRQMSYSAKYSVQRFSLDTIYDQWIKMLNKDLYD